MMHLIVMFVLGILTGISFIMAVISSIRTKNKHKSFMNGFNEGLKMHRHEIPMKPVENVLGFICPVCGRNVWGIVSKMYYCAHCGQKMGWDEAEAELEEKKGQAHDK